jgi:hypothetical protein
MGNRRIFWIVGIYSRHGRLAMKGSILAGLVLAFVLVFAQGARTQDAQAPKEHRMTGCLTSKGAAPNAYQLIDVEKGPKSVGIVSSSANLAPHVGHKIEITGTEVPAKEAAEANAYVPESPYYMKVTAVKMVSTTCP